MTEIEKVHERVRQLKSLLPEVVSYEQPKIRWHIIKNQFCLAFYLFESWLEQQIRLRSKIANNILYWLSDMMIEGRFPQKIGKYCVVDTSLVWSEEVSN